MCDDSDDNDSNENDDDNDYDDENHKAVRKGKDAAGLRLNPADASFWRHRGDRGGDDDGDGDVDNVEMDGDPGGRTPQSLAQDQWEELPLIKEGNLDKV